MTALCTICHSPLDIPGRPWTIDCGGHCCACMAEAGDPDCVAALAPIAAGGWRLIDTCSAHVEDAILGGWYPNGLPWVEKAYRRRDGQWAGHIINKPTHWQPVPDCWTVPPPPPVTASEPNVEATL